FFGEMVLRQKSLPTLIGCSLRILFAGVGDAGGNLGIGGGRKIGRLHLLAKKFLVDEAVEYSAAVVHRELGELSVREESFVAESLVPSWLQDDVAVDGRDDAVDHLGRGGRRRECQAGEKQSDDRDGDRCTS